MYYYLIMLLLYNVDSSLLLLYDTEKYIIDIHNVILGLIITQILPKIFNSNIYNIHIKYYLDLFEPYQTFCKRFRNKKKKSLLLD